MWVSEDAGCGIEIKDTCGGATVLYIMKYLCGSANNAAMLTQSSIYKHKGNVHEAGPTIFIYLIIKIDK